MRTSRPCSQHQQQGLGLAAAVAQLQGAQRTWGQCLLRWWVLSYPLSEDSKQALPVLNMGSVLAKLVAKLALKVASGASCAALDRFLVHGLIFPQVDPLVAACERSAEALAPDAPSRVDEGAPRIDPSARRVYLINCLTSAANALVHRPSAASRAKVGRWAGT